MYIPEEYRKTALISQEELEDENHFMCDTGVLELIPPAFANNTVVFPYSRLYCDVERFRDGSEPMEAYGMGFIYTSDSRGREMFCPTTEHRKSVSAIYDRHHSRLNRRTTEILKEHERCLIIDLHSFSDETVNRLFGWTDFPDVCIGTEPDYYSEELVKSICCFCRWCLCSNIFSGGVGMRKSEREIKDFQEPFSPNIENIKDNNNIYNKMDFNSPYNYQTEAFGICIRKDKLNLEERNLPLNSIISGINSELNATPKFSKRKRLRGKNESGNLKTCPTTNSSIKKRTGLSSSINKNIEKKKLQLN